MTKIKPFHTLLLGTVLLAGTPKTQGLTELEDAEMSQVQGAGLAFPFDEFRFQMAPTSFLEFTGSDTDPLETTFIRGDLRYYGLTMSRGSSGGAGGSIWNSNLQYLDGSTCSDSGFFGLGCPASGDNLINFANFDNPYVWRAFNYTGFEPDGTPTSDRSVFEILGPSNMDPFRWSFFGEVESGREVGAVNSNGLAPITGANCDAGSGSGCLTHMQNIILGKPVSLEKPVGVAGGESASNPYRAPVLRFFQYAGIDGDAENPATYGIQYEHRLSGDYRLSVHSDADTPSRGELPTFTNREGLYFRDVQAYLPLGQLHYQALVFDDSQPGNSGMVTTNGNISIELTRIPNVTDVYNDFYSLAPGDTEGYQRTGRPDRYYETHGYVEWGTKFPDNGGVSQVRYAGADPDGPTLQITQANFPSCVQGTYAGMGGANGGNPCYVNAGNGGSGTPGSAWDGNWVGDIVEGAEGSAEAVLSEGGIIFVSRDGSSTWQVVNNQNLAPQEDLHMLWVESGGEWAGTEDNWETGYRLTRDARYSATPNSNGNYYNPTLNVNAINLGSSRVEGLQINHMKIETLGGD